MEREKCGDCGHGAHHDGACQTVTVSGPKSTSMPTPTDLHPGRDVDPCECQTSTPYRNGKQIT